MEKIPAEGPAILVSNHQAVMDSFFFPLLCPRQITFLAKAEYFTTPGIKGWLQKQFFSGSGKVLRHLERRNLAATRTENQPPAVAGHRLAGVVGRVVVAVVEGDDLVHARQVGKTR